MPTEVLDQENGASLRDSALRRLTPAHIQITSRGSASQAMGVLHDLASSPKTAADALALLHELQVHQVELEIQDEELRRSRAEMEIRLGRCAQLYECTPVACLTLDRQMVVGDVNSACSSLLGKSREEITGKNIAAYVGREDVRTLAGLLDSADTDAAVRSMSLQVVTADGKRKSVRASVAADPAGTGIVIALVDISQNSGEPPAAHRR